MASLSELQDALIAADKAGNVDDARALADAIANFDTSPKITNAAENQRLFDEQPTWKKPLIAADDIVRKIADGATFGYADKLAAWANGSELADERKKTQEASDRSGYAGDAAELGGAVGGITSAGIPSAMRFIPQGAGLLSRLSLAGLLGAGEGAGYGALSAKGHDTDVSDGAINGAIGGAIIAPGVEGLSSITAALGRRMSGVNKTPSLDDLTKARQAQYKDVETREAMYPADRYRNTVNDLNTDLMNKPHGGIREVRHPASFDQMQQFNETASTAQKDIPLYNLDIDRQVVNQDVMPENTKFGSRMLQGIDDLIGNTTGVTTTRGTPQEAVDSLLSARGANRREQAYKDVAFADEKATRQAQRNKRSDGGPIRNKISQILDSPNNSRGFTDGEIGLMKEVVDGTRGGKLLRNAADTVGGLAGMSTAGGAGFSAGTMALGPALGGPLGAGAGLSLARGAGAGLRGLAEGSSSRQIDDLLHLIATGRRFETGKGNRGMSRGSESELERILLMLQNQGDEDQGRN